jgi:serine/threonine-protein kinase
VAGRTIGGRYRLLEPLGTGGMAAVWAAEDLELERRVAVKLLAPDADRARFEREARLLAAVGHPNVVRLFDFGEDEGAPYMVLELLPGGTLEERLVRGRPLPDDEARRIAAEMAAGLAAAHDQELVHRDLKPSNVLFDDEGRAKLADFGIARSAHGGTLTEPGTVLGTASYISPEQASGEPASPASDVYSFGVILYRLLAGRLPFESGSAAELVQAHAREEPQPISDLRADAPPDLARVALAALAKDPAARPPDGGALLDELGQPVSTLPMSPAGETTAVIAPRPRRPVSRTAAIVAALLVLAGAGAALAIVAWQDEDAPAAPKAPDRSRTESPGGETDASPPPASEPTADTTTATEETTPATTETVPTTDTVPTEPIPTVDTSVATTTEPPTEPPPPITTETTGTGPIVP